MSCAKARCGKLAMINSVLCDLVSKILLIDLLPEPIVDCRVLPNLGGYLSFGSAAKLENLVCIFWFSYLDYFASFHTKNIDFYMVCMVN